jgi:hypothetical protein
MHLKKRIRSREQKIDSLHSWQKPRCDQMCQEYYNNYVHDKIKTCLAVNNWDKRHYNYFSYYAKLPTVSFSRGLSFNVT